MCLSASTLREAAAPRIPVGSRPRRAPGPGPGAASDGRYAAAPGLDAPAFQQCGFGVNIAVATADQPLVVSHRADEVRSGPGPWGSSVNEGLSRHTDSAGRNAPDLYDVARRGMREELSLEPHAYTITPCRPASWTWHGGGGAPAPPRTRPA
ncbi:hypothetical protein GCM10020295_05590 [Streptomyces cinereospinus]